MKLLIIHQLNKSYINFNIVQIIPNKTQSREKMLQNTFKNSKPKFRKCSHTQKPSQCYSSRTSKENTPYLQQIGHLDEQHTYRKFTIQSQQPSNSISSVSHRMPDQECTNTWQFLKSRRESQLNNMFNIRKNRLNKIMSQNFMIYDKINTQESHYGHYNSGNKAKINLKSLQKYKTLECKENVEESQRKVIGPICTFKGLKLPFFDKQSESRCTLQQKQSNTEAFQQPLFFQTKHFKTINNSTNSQTSFNQTGKLAYPRAKNSKLQKIQQIKLTRIHEPMRTARSHFSIKSKKTNIDNNNQILPLLF